MAKILKGNKLRILLETKISKLETKHHRIKK